MGAACAADATDAVWWRVALAGLVSVSLQVGVNYANDYSDGVRGTDDVRVGPVRLVASGLASPAAVKRAAIAALALAAVAGLALAALTTWWLLAVGVAALVAAWTYTGGPRPYGYAGLGEVFVFVFFGLVATVGTEYAVATRITLTSVVASVAVGCFACALLVVNNLRDIPTDVAAGKRTLAVRLGDARTRKFLALLVVASATAVVATGVIADVWALGGLIGVFATKPALDAVARGARGRDLIAVLGVIGRAQMVLGLTYSVGLVIALSR